jgi:transcription elongation factor Elf1
MIPPKTINCQRCKKPISSDPVEIVVKRKQTLYKYPCKSCGMINVHLVAQDHLFSGNLYHQPKKVNFHKAIKSVKNKTK